MGRPHAAATKAGRGRHVDQPRPVAAGAAAIGEEIVGPVERQSGRAKRMGRADHLLGGLALHPQRDEHAGDLGGLEPAEHKPLEQMLGIVDRQVFAARAAWAADWAPAASGSWVAGGAEARGSPARSKVAIWFMRSPENKKARRWRAGSRMIGKASRSVAPSRRTGAIAPPQVSGRACSDGDQVRHANRVVG